MKNSEINLPEEITKWYQIQIMDDRLIIGYPNPIYIPICEIREINNRSVYNDIKIMCKHVWVTLSTKKIETLTSVWESE